MVRPATEHGVNLPVVEAVPTLQVIIEQLATRVLSGAIALISGAGTSGPLIALAPHIALGFRRSRGAVSAP